MFTNVSDDLLTLKLKPEEQKTIAAILASRLKPERRRAPRCYLFTDPVGLVIHIAHPGGSEVIYRIRPRDLSELGMGFLHGNFIYPQSRCRFELIDMEGNACPIAGRIARCEHLSGRVHDVGVEFDQPLEPARFKSIVIDQHHQPQPEVPRPSYWRQPVAEKA